MTGPSTILLTCFLGTGAVALLAQAGRNDAYQPHIVFASATIAVAAGAFLECNLQESIFVFLFWGCIAGVLVSKALHFFLPLGRKAEVEVDRGTGALEGVRGEKGTG